MSAQQVDEAMLMNADDPYRPPQSELAGAVSNDLQARAWPWKAYFFISTALTVLGFHAILADPAAGRVDYFYLVVAALATVGVFGFAFNRAYLMPAFWRALLVMSLGFALAYDVLTHIDLRMGLSPLAYLAAKSVAWVLMLPGCVALYRYGRPEDHVWQPKK